MNRKVMWGRCSIICTLLFDWGLKKRKKEDKSLFQESRWGRDLRSSAQLHFHPPSINRERKRWDGANASATTTRKPTKWCLPWPVSLNSQSQQCLWFDKHYPNTPREAGRGLHHHLYYTYIYSPHFGPTNFTWPHLRPFSLLSVSATNCIVMAPHMPLSLSLWFPPH